MTYRHCFDRISTARTTFLKSTCIARRVFVIIVCMGSNGAAAGILIAIDGIDGAGKTTQVERICAALRAAGENVVQSKEPTNGPYGRRLRESAQNGRMSPDDELATFIADRREHVKNVIAPALSQGHVVVLDRYFYSTIAYQGTRLQCNACELLDRMREFPTPDLAVLIDVDPVVGLHRIQNTRGDIPNEFERLESLRDIREHFLQLLECADELYKVDGHPSVEYVYHEIAHKLVEVMRPKRCFKPYECDMLLCSYRISGECTWPSERTRLLTPIPIVRG